MPIPALIAPLLAQGLNLLGNAVLVKGKEWLEQQTGVSLDKPLSPEDTLKLRQFEIEREQELIKLRQVDDRLSADMELAYLKDRQDARARDNEFTRTGRPNYRSHIMFMLAVAMVGVVIWIVWKDPSINEYVKGIFTLVLGRFLGYLDNIYNFEFGTTRGSRDKDDTINRLSQGGDR
jgi:hypothetical protein